MVLEPGSRSTARLRNVRRAPAATAMLLALALLLSILGSACSDSGDQAAGPKEQSSTPGPPDGAPVTGCDSDRPARPGTEVLTVDGDRSEPGDGDETGDRNDPDEVDEPGDGDETREVERVIPASYDGVEPAPLLLSLHGFTSNIEQIDLFSDLPGQAAERGYVLLTPQALPATVPIGEDTIEAPFWNVLPEQARAMEGAHDDLTFLSDLIDDTIAELCIDVDRVHATGNSNGAGMAAALACQGDDRIAAIAPVSGVNLAGGCDDPDEVSVIAFHGDADPLVAYEGGSAASLDLDVPSVPYAVASFAEAGGCEEQPAVSKPFDDIQLSLWAGCDAGIGVELYTVLGGGHTWPGMLNYVEAAKLSALGESQELAKLAGLDLGEIAGHMTTSIEATELMLDFFDEHQRVS